jgi:hypothetical protein
MKKTSRTGSVTLEKIGNQFGNQEERNSGIQTEQGPEFPRCRPPTSDYKNGRDCYPQEF